MSSSGIVGEIDCHAVGNVDGDEVQHNSNSSRHSAGNFIDGRRFQRTADNEARSSDDESVDTCLSVTSVSDDGSGNSDEEDEEDEEGDDAP